MAIRALREPGLHFVGVVPGLAIRVKPSGAKSWVLRVVVGGKRRDHGLGAYPEITLAEAHQKAREARDSIRKGVDPIEERKTVRSELKAAQAKERTFREVTDECIKAHESGWRNAKHALQWRNTLEQYVFPTMGDLKVQHIDKTHILNALQPIWTTKHETATRVRQRIEVVLSFAVQAGYRPEGLNPARLRGNLDKILVAPKEAKAARHFKALPYQQMGAFMQRLRETEGQGATALEFAILTAARSGEVRGARWSEIDLVAKMWVVPAIRMKAGREHRVPLSGAAMSLLQKQTRTPGSELVFTAPKGGALSDMTLTAVLRRLGVDATVHGFRSAFRDWLSERTNYPNEAGEVALAHVVSDKTEAAYRRGDQLERRIQMMEDWASYISRVERTAEVIDLSLKRA